MIEASPLSIPQWYVDLGEKSLTKEEETFYVAAVVKLFLSSLRSEAPLSSRECHTTSPAGDLCWGLSECVRLPCLTRPSIRVGVCPPLT